MSEEATRQTRSPADNMRTEEATSQAAGRWRHPSPAPGHTTSPAPAAPDQSRAGYTTEPAPQVSPQPILPTDSEATLTSTEMRVPQNQPQAQQAGQVTTTIHIPQHPYNPHHKYQLLHGVISDSQQQQIIQHSNTVIQQQQQQQQQQTQQPEVTDQSIVEDQQPQVSEQVTHPSTDPPTQEHSAYTSVTPVPVDPQHPQQQQVQASMSPYSAAAQQQDVHEQAASVTAPQPETLQAQTAVPVQPAGGRDTETPTISVQHPSATVKEVYRSLGKSPFPFYLSLSLCIFPSPSGKQFPCLSYLGSITICIKRILISSTKVNFHTIVSDLTPGKKPLSVRSLIQYSGRSVFEGW